MKKKLARAFFWLCGLVVYAVLLFGVWKAGWVSTADAGFLVIGGTAISLLLLLFLIVSADDPGPFPDDD